MTGFGEFDTDVVKDRFSVVHRARGGLRTVNVVQGFLPRVAS